MGVVKLWDIIEEKSDRQWCVSVCDLRNQTLAIDVSAWIVELEHLQTSRRNIYIRNLFFRILGLLNAGVNLIAVLDGEAPALKSNTLMKRSQGGTANLDRPFLRQKSRECKKVFECCGIPCIESHGEAEALCAYLEKKKVVDGCITADGDYFCYGGQTVYRHFKRDGATYMVDRYSTANTDMSQDDFIALALMLGSDLHEKGVEHVGPVKGLKLIQLLKKRNINAVDRLISWRSNEELTDIENKLNEKEKKPSHCTRCQHTGKLKVHTSAGCTACDTRAGCIEHNDVTCTCSWHQLKHLQEEHKLELSIRQLAIKDPSFPNKQIIAEYRDFKMDIPVIHKTKMINVSSLIDCLRLYLGYEKEKTVDYITQTVILYELRHSVTSSNVMFTPDRIIKKCVHNKVECYLIEWKKTEKNQWAYKECVEEKIERELFQSVYPDIVAQFNAQQTPKKTPKGKKKASDDQSQILCSPSKKKDIRSFFPVKK